MKIEVKVNRHPARRGHLHCLGQDADGPGGLAGDLDGVTTLDVTTALLESTERHGKSGVEVRPTAALNVVIYLNRLVCVEVGAAGDDDERVSVVHNVARRREGDACGVKCTGPCNIVRAVYGNVA